MELKEIEKYHVEVRTDSFARFCETVIYKVVVFEELHFNTVAFCRLAFYCL